MNSKTKLKVPTGTATLNLLSWILVVFILTAGVLLIPRVNAVEAAVTESAEVNGYTWYYTVETINNTKVATNVYLESFSTEENITVTVPDYINGFMVYSLGNVNGVNKDSFIHSGTIDAFITIDASKCNHLKRINSYVGYGNGPYYYKLPASVTSIGYGAFEGASKSGVMILNPNLAFDVSADNTLSSFKSFASKVSSAQDFYQSKNYQSGTVFGNQCKYEGPNTCKLNFTSDSKYKANLGSGLFNTYVYAVSDENASEELQQATYCNIPTSDLYDFQGYYFGDVPQTEEEAKQKPPIFDANGVFNYQAFQAQCSPKAGDTSIVLTAKWTPKSFKAVLVCEGDKSKSFTINYVYGDKISLPIDCPFVILGQTVEKWTCNGVEYNPGDNIPSETFGSTPPNFYPITRLNTYSIRYLSGNSSDDAHVIPEEHTFSNVEKFTLKKNVYEKLGYFFRGWTTLNPTYIPASDLKVMYYDEQEVPCLGGFQKDKEIVDLYAVWEIRSVDVSYVDETGTEVETQRAEYAGKDTEIHKNVYNKNDYDVDFYTDQNGKVYTEDGHIDALSYKQHEKVILTPTFKKSQYKIRIGTEEYSAYVSDDFEIPKYTGYSQEGYCFAGWDVKTPLLKKGDRYLIPKSTQKKNTEIHLSPIWEKETYRIHYDTVVSEDAPSTYQVGDRVVLPALQREGYKFLGWNNGSSTITEITSGIGNLSLTAKWEEIRYSLYCPQQPAALTINGVRVYSPDKASYNFAYCKKIDAVGIENNISGKTMTGFTITDDRENVLYTYSCDPTKSLECTIPKDVVLDPSKVNMALNIVYGNERYTLTYNPNGGILSEDAQKFYISGEKTDLPEPSKENYEFVGWDDGNGNRITKISPDTIGNLSLTAVYERKKCNVTLDYDGGTADDKINSISYIYEEGNLDLPKAPTREGHTFIGWYDEVLKRFVKTVDTSISTDRTIRAMWTRNAASGIPKITVNPKTFVDMEYSHSVFDDNEGYYYSQLSDGAKKLYTEVYYYFSQRENFYTQTSLRYSVDGKTTEAELETAMAALLMERPELFWIKAFDLSDISDGKVCVTPRFAYDNIDAYADRDEFDSNINELVAVNGNTIEERLENLIAEFHNRKFKICKNGDDTVNKLKSAAHLCVFKEGTSESVAKLIRILCRSWNIPSIVCYGESSCWNLIQVGTDWFYVNAANETPFKSVSDNGGGFYSNATMSINIPPAKEIAVPTPPSNPDAPAQPTNDPGAVNIGGMPTQTQNPPEPTPAPKAPSQFTVKEKGVTYTCKMWKKGLTITKITTKKSTITIPTTLKVKGKRYKVLQFNKNVFKGCKKLKTVKLRAKISLAKGALKGLNTKVKVFVPKKYYKPMKKILTSKKSGWKKSMKLKRG